MIKFSQLEKHVNGKILKLTSDYSINHLITDSRRVMADPHSIFFAQQGPSHDGHSFIDELYETGIRNFVIEKEIKIDRYPEANFIIVSSTLAAMQQLVSYHRNQFDPIVIGITGSNGKTIIKEWLQQLLSVKYRIVATPHSYNSQLGVPLAVWQMNENHDLGIFEAGISKPGEMENLEKIIKPEIGIYTNIGPAHDQGFSSRKEKIEEKLKLFRSSKTLIYCKDHKLVDDVVLKTLPEIKKFTWGLAPESDIQIIQKRKKSTAYLIQLLYKDKTYEFDLPVKDPASFENLLHCIVCMFFLKYSYEEIKDRIRIITPVSMRLEFKKGLNGCYIIDDSYNNDIAGLKIALDFLKQQKQRKTKTVILSDIFQAGIGSEELYKEVNYLLEQHKINRLIAVGSEISACKDCFSIDTLFFPTTIDFLRWAEPKYFHEEMILVKGARNFTFEHIVNRLQEKIHGTRLEINLGAVTHNLNFFRTRIKRGTKLMVMVKAFAYGSGMYEIANLLQYHKVDYLGVAYTDEGVNLRQNGIEIPIMIMNPSPEGYEQLIKYNLEPEVYGFQQLRTLLHFLKGRKLNIHLKLDTGMNRLGFQKKDIDGLVEALQKAENITIKSIFSHLAAADEVSHEDFSRKQAELFIKMADHISNILSIKPIKHILNTAGIIRYPDYQLDMVRLGIGLYGIEPAGIAQGQLQPISTLKTIISQIREVEPGESIGYGRHGKAEDRKTIATIAIGYADGFSRFFSNGKGEVTINGKRAPVVGNVCMDMTMIDVTGMEVNEGDDVVVFGENPTISEMAKRIGTIPYEILTNVSERVKRIYLYD